MALATRCPHCHTTFRVAHDQLKLRAGLVRCGACKEIFNGVEHLLPAGERPQTVIASNPAAAIPVSVRESAEPAASEHSGEATENAALPASEKPAGQDESTDIPAASTEASAAAGANVNGDPLQRMTLMDFSAWKEGDEADPAPEENTSEGSHSEINNSGDYSQTEPPAEAPDELDRAIDDLQRKPWRRKRAKRGADDDIEGDDDATEPDFVRRARRQQQIGRTLRVLAGLGSVILLMALAAQSLYAFRNQIAARLPQMTPLLAQACSHIGCEVGFPAQIDAVSIESSELQTLVPNQNTFVLNALLRNRSSIAQAWPSIELTLNDANEKAIARRVFSPREYLASANDSRKGFDANSEQQVRVFFELSELKASGYRVYLFYP